MWVGQRGKRDLEEGEGNEWRDARNKIERRVKGDRDRQRQREKENNLYLHVASTHTKIGKEGDSDREGEREETSEIGWDERREGG